MKQTAVEWLEIQIKNCPTDGNVMMNIDGFIQQAKEMEKEQAKTLYSEEDLEYAFEQGKLNSNICYRRTFKNVLEILQFKKK